MIPIISEDATTCCQRNAQLGVLAKDHMENAGDDWIPIRANMYVMHIIPVQGPPTDFEPLDTN